MRRVPLVDRLAALEQALGVLSTKIDVVLLSLRQIALREKVAP